MAAAHVAEVESTLERLRLELTEADARTTAAREAAHASELEIGKLQQQIAFDKQQVESLGAAAADIENEVRALEARREPARVELESRRDAAVRATSDRDQAAETLRGEEAAYADLQRNIEALEADVEAARSEMFAAVNAATALRHAMEHAAAARARLADQIGKLEGEGHDLHVELERAAHDRSVAEASMGRAGEAIDELRLDRAAKDSDLSAARAERDARTQEFRARERELAGVNARLKSLEELDAARAEYGDGARLLLSESRDAVSQLGSVADYLDVDGRYERAVEACLGDLLQHVVVESSEQAAAGLAFARAHDAGRVGFLIAGSAPAIERASSPHPDLTALADVVAVSGPASDVIRAAIANAWIAGSYDSARAAAASTDAPIATLDGEVFHGAHIVEGGARAEARGILTTKREIKELRERAEAERLEADRLRDVIASLDVTIALPGVRDRRRAESSSTGRRRQPSGSSSRSRVRARPWNASPASRNRLRPSAGPPKNSFGHRRRGRTRRASRSRASKPSSAPRTIS